MLNFIAFSHACWTNVQHMLDLKKIQHHINLTRPEFTDIKKGWGFKVTGPLLQHYGQEKTKVK